MIPLWPIDAGPTAGSTAGHLAGRAAPGAAEPTRSRRVVAGSDAAEPNAAGLLEVVYAELRRLAARKMAQERPGQTLQPTALVHEAWIRLGGDGPGRHWDSREHFFAAAAEAMRRILIDRARRRGRIRHGAGWDRVDVEVIDLPIAQDGDKCLRVHEALDRLAAVDRRKAEVVKMRVFVGMEVAEIADVLGLSEKSVQRDWVFAKAWLSRELQDP